MKKLVLFLTLVLVFGSFSTVSASLIGVGPLIANQYPDILFNNTGVIDYDAGSNQFALTADDIKIAYSPTQFEYIIGITLSINLTIDENGDIVGTGSMTEIVDDGASVTINDVTYGEGTTILAGDIYAFGWGETANAHGYWDFDFLIDNVSGVLIDNALWPDNDIGITAAAETLNGWAGSWDNDFELNKVKGDKAPIPEPATMALMALGGLLLRKRK